MRVLLIGAALSLTGCDSLPTSWSRDDLEEIAQSAAADEASVVQARLSDLESKVSEQETEISYLQSQVNSLESELALYR